MSGTPAPFELRCLTVGEWEENCYLVVEGGGSQAILIDPGAEPEKILDWIKGLRISRILLTHAHSDHIGAVPALRSALSLAVGLHPGDAALALGQGLEADFPLNDGDRFPIGKGFIQVVHTPGHTSGSVCLLYDQAALVGDAVFPGGPGHTRTPEELAQSLESLHRTVFKWPDGTRLYPGHGRSTTVGAERPAFEGFLNQPLPPDLFGDVTWRQAVDSL